MGKGVGDNYIEVVETGGLLIPNAVTLIKAGREGGLRTTGVQFNSEQKKKKKKILRFISLASSRVTLHAILLN